MVAYVRTTSTSNYSSSEGVSSRAARPTEAFLSRGSAMEHGHYAESSRNSGSKPKEEGSGEGGRERKDEFGDWPWTSRPFGPTNRPKDILKTTGRDDVFSFSLFAGPRHSDLAFSFSRTEYFARVNFLGYFYNVDINRKFDIWTSLFRQDQTNFPIFLHNTNIGQLWRFRSIIIRDRTGYIASVTYSFRNCPIRFAKGERDRG